MAAKKKAIPVNPKTKTDSSQSPKKGRRASQKKTISISSILNIEDEQFLKNSLSAEVDGFSNEEEENEDVKFDAGYIQWSVGENGKYIPCFKTVKKVPAGIYEMRMSQNLGFHIQRQLHFSDDLIELPMKETQEILSDIKKFWTRENVFKQYGYTHKRGILMHGPPGCGKSYLIQVLSRHLIKEMNGIVINLKDYDSVALFLDFAGPVIRTIEKETPIIVIMEDIDNILEYSHSVLTKVLNMLDGLKQINKVVYIATTNYPEKLQDRVANRPSRFDRKYKISTPDATVREAYIRSKLRGEDIKKVDVKKWVKETEGLSIAHIKELILSILVFDIEFEKAIEILRTMGERASSLRDSGQSIGFANNSGRLAVERYDEAGYGGYEKGVDEGF